MDLPTLGGPIIMVWCKDKEGGGGWGEGQRMEDSGQQQLTRGPLAPAASAVARR